MSDVLPWLDYRWSFDSPVGMYRVFCARLHSIPARLEELVRRHSHEALTRKPEGKWSVHEQAGHLWVLEELTQARIEQYLRGETLLIAADMTNRRTHEAGFNQMPLDEILRGFRSSRDNLMRRLDALTLAEAARVATHPRLQKQLRLVDFCCFVVEHDDHHLAVIRELLRHAA
jgi:hypothetical protein